MRRLFIVLLFGLLSGTLVFAQDDAFDQFGNDDAPANAAPPPGADGPAVVPGIFGGAPSPTAAQQQELAQEVQVLYDQAKQLQEANEYDAAIQKYREILETKSRNFAPAYLETGRIQREQGYLQQAIQSFGTATALSPAAIEPLSERGQVYMDLERYNEAIVDFETALLLKPGDPELLYNLGLAQTEFAYTQILSSAREEDLIKAVDSFTGAIDGRPDYSEAYFERGSALLNLGQLDDALDDLAKAVELDPQNPEAVAQYGFASLRRGSTEAQRRNGQRAKIVSDFQRAADYFTRYFELVPPIPAKNRDKDKDEDDASDIRAENVFVNRAAAHIGLGDESQSNRDMYYQNAIRDAEEAMRMNPDFAAPYFQKGLAQRMMNDFEGALDSFTESIARNPNDVESMLRRGIIEFRLGDYQLARADFAAANRLQLNPRATFWSGLANAKMGEFNQAINDYSTTLRYQPYFVSGYLNRGLAFMKIGRFDRAVADFNEVLRTDRNHPMASSMRDKSLQLAKGR